MKTPPPSRDPREFWTLRETPLHEMTPALWKEYYPAMAPWLQAADAEIRDCAVERLMMAVFQAEYRYIRKNDPRAEEARDRTAWLLGEIERAHAVYPDIIPRFLHGLRHHGDDEPFRALLFAWLDGLASERREGIDAGLIQGTRLLVARGSDNATTAVTDMIGLLDHPSDYVRGCAAHLLGNFCDDESDPNFQALLEIIGGKELERPGVAGPFWSPRHSFGDETQEPVTLWMLDLYERRKGAVPALPVMPFSDIEFYLHELCSFSPELMWRMLRGGHTALALMTATEINDRVDGVQPILETLASDADPGIAVRARNHLAAHYRPSPAIGGL
jgi:hypothetical protein